MLRQLTEACCNFEQIQPLNTTCMDFADDASSPRAWDHTCSSGLSMLVLQTMDPIAENASAYEEAFNKHQQLGASLFAS